MQCVQSRDRESLRGIIDKSFLRETGGILL